MSFDDETLAIFQTQVEIMLPGLLKLRESSVEWGRHSDWPWNGFVLSYSTLGGSANWEKRIGPIYDAQYGWTVLAALSIEERSARFAVLGNPRYRKKISVWLGQSYVRIEHSGGPPAIRSGYEACASAQARIDYIRSFPGFGEKYGRNIPMDRYDELVRNHFALDHRLKTVLSDCGYSKVNYSVGETLLCHLAGQLGIDAWTLDRVIYGRFSQLREALSRRQGNPEVR